jgi:hypothetical protein
MRRLLIISVLVTGILFGIVAQPEAAIMTFASRAAFAAAFPGATVENWDSYPAGTIFPDGSTTAGITYNSSAGNALVTSNFLALSAPNGLGDTSAGFFGGNDSITFSFGSPLSAFGISINTFAMTNGAYTATTNLGDVGASFLNPFPGATTGQFVGFSSTLPFTSVTIAPASGVTYTLDDLRYQSSAPIPEPATLSLVGLGIGGGLAARRRRRLK